MEVSFSREKTLKRGVSELQTIDSILFSYFIFSFYF